MAAKPVPRKRGDDVVWRLPFRLKPGGMLTSETFDTREEAEKFGRLVDAVGGAAARQTRTASTDSAAEVPTLGTWFERHLTELGASTTPGTVAEYRRTAARTWLPSLGPLPLDAIDRSAVITWVTAQRGTETQVSRRARERAIASQRKDPAVAVPAARTYSPKSIANAHGLLSSVLEAAVQADVLTRNVAKGVPLPSDHERAEMVLLTEAEMTDLVAALPERWRPLVGTLAGTGVRWGEATALTPGDLDLDGVTPVLRVTRAWKKGAAGVYLGGPKTLRGRRTVSLPDWLVPILRAQIQGKGSGDLLFTSVEGGRVTAQRFHERVWTPAIARAGLTKRPRVHDLRHGHASLMIAQGMDLLTLQHRLGHQSLKTTGDTYGHLLPDAHARSAVHASGVLGGAFPQIES